MWGSPGRRLGLSLGAGDMACSLRGQLRPVWVWTLPCPGQCSWPSHSPVPRALPWVRARVRRPRACLSRWHRNRSCTGEQRCQQPRPGSLALHGGAAGSGAQALPPGSRGCGISTLRSPAGSQGWVLLSPVLECVPQPFLNVCFFSQTNLGTGLGRGIRGQHLEGLGDPKIFPPSHLRGAPQPAWPGSAVCRPAGAQPSVPIRGARAVLPAVEGTGWGRAAWLGRTRARGSLDKALLGRRGQASRQAPSHPSLGENHAFGGGKPPSTSAGGTGADGMPLPPQGPEAGHCPL